MFSATTGLDNCLEHESSSVSILVLIGSIEQDFSIRNFPIAQEIHSKIFSEKWQK